MKVLPKDKYLSSLSPEIEDAVANNLAGTEVGRLKDWTSPLIPDKSDPRAGRLEVIREMTQWLFPTGLQWLDEVEQESIEKIGPMSIQLPYRERTDVIYDYFSQPNIYPDKDAWRHATEQTEALVRNRLSPAGLETAYNDMPRGTNLGLPFASADAEYRPMVLELARAISRSGYAMQPDPCILYWRGQSRGLDEPPKQRTVWGYPHYLTLFELQLQIPLLKYLRNKMEFAAWNPPDTVNRAVTYVMDNSRQDILSVDFSRFDASAPNEMIDVIFDIMAKWFVPRVRDMIEYVRDSFLNIGLLTPEGILVERNGGVPSGSGLTNLIDSLLQIFAFHYVAYRTNNTIDMHLVQGDDGVVAFHDPWDLDEVVEYSAELNLKVSADKGGVSRTHVSFLQNHHSTDWVVDGKYVGIRPLARIIGSAMSYERFKSHWTGADDSLRWIEQFNDGQYHPRFPEAISFLYSKDRYLRRYTVPQLIDKGGGPENVESALELKAFPYGKLPLEEFESSPVLKQVAQFKHLKR